jgi:TolB-like protein/DNA-binding winged helix-turn-helix (wHTH) protein
VATRRSYEFGDFRLDPARRRIGRKNGETVALNAKAFDALVYLVEHAGEPVSRTALTEALWPNRIVEDNNLSQAISALRREIGDGCIATLAGRGYQFVAEIRSADPESESAAAAHSEPPNGTGASAEPTVAAAAPASSAPLSPPRRFSAPGIAAIAAGAALTILAVWGYVRMGTPGDDVAAAVAGEPMVKLLVVPFASLSSDPEQREFSDGLTDELIIRLQQLSSLRVTGRTTAFALRNSERSVPDIAAELGVQYVLEGSIGRYGDRLRIREQLSDASGFSVWAESYDRPLASLFEIQDEIVSAIAAELPNQLGLDRALQHASTTSLEAYQLYLQARSVGLAGPITREAYARPFALLDRSLQLDSQLAASWALKSKMHGALYTSLVDGQAELAAAEQAAEHAIELAPDQSDGYSARALVRGIRGEWHGAERDSAQARKLASRDTDPDQWLLLASGRLEKGRKTLAEFLERDPLDPAVLAFFMLSHELLGDTKSADALYERGNTLFEPWVVGKVVSSWILLGRRDIESITEDRVPLDILAEFPELIGDRERALERLKEAALDPEYQAPNMLATLAIWSAHFGDSRLAVRLLDKAVTGSALLTYLAWLPVFEDVRRLPEFKELLVKRGLVDYWRATAWPDVCGPSGETDFDCTQ